MSKQLIKQKLQKIFQSKDYETIDYFGPFDISAKNDEKFLIKILFNIDSLKEVQAKNLKVMAKFLDANPVIISFKTNRSKLSDRVLYSRYQIPVVTFYLFKKIVEQQRVESFATRGKVLVQIDLKKLKEERKKQGISLSQLSKLVKISKKCLYEIEAGKTNPKLETAMKLEETLGVKLIKNVASTKLQQKYNEKLLPKSKFEQEILKQIERIGVEASAVYNMPFQLLGSFKKTIFLKIGQTKEIEKIVELCRFFDCSYLLISEKKEKAGFITFEELKRVKTPQQFLKLAKSI